MTPRERLRKFMDSGELTLPRAGAIVRKALGEIVLDLEEVLPREDGWSKRDMYATNVAWGSDLRIGVEGFLDPLAYHDPLFPGGTNRLREFYLSANARVTVRRSESVVKVHISSYASGSTHEMVEREYADVADSMRAAIRADIESVMDGEEPKQVEVAMNTLAEAWRKANDNLEDLYEEAVSYVHAEVDKMGQVLEQNGWEAEPNHENVYRWQGESSEPHLVKFAAAIYYHDLIKEGDVSDAVEMWLSGLDPIDYAEHGSALTFCQGGWNESITHEVAYRNVVDAANLARFSTDQYVNGEMKIFAPRRR